jgi:hypothetical protein
MRNIHLNPWVVIGWLAAIWVQPNEIISTNDSHFQAPKFNITSQAQFLFSCTNHEIAFMTTLALTHTHTHRWIKETYAAYRFVYGIEF